jgi:hypothetical protein
MDLAQFNHITHSKFQGSSRPSRRAERPTTSIFCHKNRLLDTSVALFFD